MPQTHSRDWVRVRFHLCVHAPDPLPGLGKCVLPSLCMHAQTHSRDWELAWPVW